MRMGEGQTKSEVSDRPHQQFVANLLQFYGNHSDISEWAIGTVRGFATVRTQNQSNGARLLAKYYLNVTSIAKCCKSFGFPSFCFCSCFYFRFNS